MKKLWLLGLFAATVLVVNSSLAQTPPANNDTSVSYRLYPDIITNLKRKKRNSYILLRMEIKVNTEEAVNLVEYNSPLIRDKIVAMLNDSTKRELLKDRQHKRLRKKLLKIVVETLAQEPKNISANPNKDKNYKPPQAHGIVLKHIAIGDG